MNRGSPVGNVLCRGGVRILPLSLGLEASDPSAVDHVFVPGEPHDKGVAADNGKNRKLRVS